jgi:hypothetical protein
MTGKEDSRNKRNWTRDYDNTIFGFWGFEKDMMKVEKLRIDGWIWK